MDAFEQVVAGLLFQEGYWVTQGFKVDLTKEEKRKIGRPSSPRWEVDLLAYRGSTNELLVVECKSFLDSNGVKASEVLERKPSKSRYKLFTDPTLRKVVFRRLAIQANEMGLISIKAEPQLALAAGKIRSESDQEQLEKHFKRKKWVLFTPEWIVSRLLTSADESYHDTVSHVVSKLIKRNPIR